MQVSLPDSSRTHNSFVRTRLTKKSPMLFAVSANHSVRREKRLSKKLATKLKEVGVEEAVVEAMDWKFRSSSLSAFTATERIAVEFIVCTVPSRLKYASCGLVEAASSNKTPISKVCNFIVIFE